MTSRNRKNTEKNSSTKRSKTDRLVAPVKDLFDWQRKRKEKGATTLYGLSESIENLNSYTIPKCAKSESHVLILGETGTGKELSVREIKRLADIPEEKFVAVNCAQFTGSLLASELFGYVSGAFTGAVKDKKGIIEDTDGGVLFLDELGAMPQELQAQILRVMEEGKYRPVGSTKPKELKKGVRFFAATNNAGNIRQDLRWRFQETLFIPPLRERLSDVFAVLEGLLDDVKSNDREINPDAQWAISPDNFVRMVYSQWPGNARELRNAVETSIASWRFDGSVSNYILFQYAPDTHAGNMLKDIRVVAALWNELVKIISQVRSRKVPKWLLRNPFDKSRLESMGTLLKLPYLLLGTADIHRLQTQLHCPSKSNGVFAEHFLSCAEAVYLVCLIHDCCLYADAIDSCESITEFHGYGNVTYSAPKESACHSIISRLRFIDLNKRILFALPTPTSHYFDTQTFSLRRLPQKRSPDLTGYQEEEILGLYYNQLLSKHSTQKAAAEAAGITKDQIAGRKNKYVSGDE